MNDDLEKPNGNNVPVKVEPDVKITQDTRVVSQVMKQVLDKVGGKGGVVVNVVTVGQVTSNFSNNSNHKVQTALTAGVQDRVRPKQFELMQFMDTLPPGKSKLTELLRYAVAATLDAFETQKEAADWLGVSKRVMHYKKQQLVDNDCYAPDIGDDDIMITIAGMDEEKTGTEQKAIKGAVDGVINMEETPLEGTTPPVNNTQPSEQPITTPVTEIPNEPVTKEEPNVDALVDNFFDGWGDDKQKPKPKKRPRLEPWVYNALQERGETMHVDDIAEVVLANGYPSTSQNFVGSIQTCLYRNSNKKFKNMGGGKFTLVDFPKQTGEI